MDRLKSFLQRPAVNFLLMAAFIATVVWAPDLFSGIVQSGMALGAAGLLLFVVVVAWSASGRGGWTNGPFAQDGERLGHVGFSGTGIGLAVSQEPGKPLRIELSHWTYLILLGLWGIFGPGVFMILCGPPEHWTVTPISPWRLVAVVYAVVIVVLPVLGVLHYLTRRGVVEVSDDAIRLLVGRATVRVIPRDEVKALTIVEHEMRDERGRLLTTSKNYSVRADLRHGNGVALCIADNRSLIEGIASAIDARLRLSA